MIVTPTEASALRTLATEGRGHATCGDGPTELHPSWVEWLDRLAAKDLVFAYPENGTLADDPGRTFYEITDAGLDALAAIRDQDRHARAYHV